MAKKEEVKKEKKEPFVKRALKKAGDYAKEEIAHQKKKSLYNALGKPHHAKHSKFAEDMRKTAMGSSSAKALYKGMAMKKKKEAEEE